MMMILYSVTTMIWLRARSAAVRFVSFRFVRFVFESRAVRSVKMFLAALPSIQCHAVAALHTFVVVVVVPINRLLLTHLQLNVDIFY
jgi:hypothetical protein